VDGSDSGVTGGSGDGVADSDFCAAGGVDFCAVDSADSVSPCKNRMAGERVRRCTSRMNSKGLRGLRDIMTAPVAKAGAEL
jgi:hypothetical protein